MSDNTVVQFKSNVPANPESLTQLGVAVAASVGGGGGGDDFLRLLRDGAWVFGAENLEPEEDSLWAINPYSFQHGFISWLDSKPVGEVMVNIMEALPARTTLPDTGGQWDEQMSFQLKCVSGEDAGQQVMFKTTSVGGKRAVSNVATAIGKRAAEGNTDVIPVVKLGSDSYQHKAYGKIYTPEFIAQSWSSGDDSPEEAAETAEAAPEPSRRSRKKR